VHDAAALANDDAAAGPAARRLEAGARSAGLVSSLDLLAESIRRQLDRDLSEVRVDIKQPANGMVTIEASHCHDGHAQRISDLACATSLLHRRAQAELSPALSRAGLASALRRMRLPARPSHREESPLRGDHRPGLRGRVRRRCRWLTERARAADEGLNAGAKASHRPTTTATGGRLAQSSRGPA
jgi:hypothetical protein